VLFGFIAVKPYVFQPDKKSKNVIEGDPFVVDCKAWGLPNVTLVWYKNGAVLESNDRVLFKNGHSDNSTLRIENVLYDDASEYNCTAENKFGTASMIVEMQVKGSNQNYISLKLLLFSKSFLCFNASLHIGLSCVCFMSVALMNPDSMD
jgi:Immunoglobulin I-set domain